MNVCSRFREKCFTRISILNFFCDYGKRYTFLGAKTVEPEKSKKEVVDKKLDMVNLLVNGNLDVE